MRYLLKDFDKHNRTTCHYTQKAIMPGRVFYCEMRPRASGAGWHKVWAVSEGEARRMVEANEAQIVTWAELKGAVE